MAIVNVQLGSRTAALDATRVGKIINASSVKEAYSVGGGLWSRICDFFVVGRERKVARDLYNAISGAAVDTSLMVQLARFQKLSNYVSPEHKGDFSVCVMNDYNNRNDFFYQFKIGQDIVFQSSPLPKGEQVEYKQFCIDAEVFNFVESLFSFTGKVGAEDSRRNYILNLIETLSDVREGNSVNHDDKTTKEFLREHLNDGFYSKENFSDIKNYDGDEVDYFDAIFSHDGEERKLRLSNRVSSMCEFRGKVARDAFFDYDYRNLEELLSLGGGYGTGRDPSVAMLFGNAMNYIALDLDMEPQEVRADPDVLSSLQDKYVTCPGANPLCLADLLYRDK